MRNTRIPLFPLNVVLLPGAALPLHIFEPRYRAMVRHCLATKTEFGMVLAGGSRVAPVGCTTEIVRVLQEYPTGESDIFTEGRATFRIREVLSENDYHEAIVEYLSDSRECTESQKEDALMGIFQQCHSLLYNQLWSPSAKDVRWPLSYRMAGALPLELPEKQELLEMRAEPARQAFLHNWLAGILEKLEMLNRSRRRATANGHSLN
jgi:Lon protease-like protein